MVALLRGDHMVNEAKLAAAVRGGDLRPMKAEEIRAAISKSRRDILGPV